VILTLHWVFLLFGLLVLAWNGLCAHGGRWLDRLTWLATAALFGVLVRDRVLAHEPPLAALPAVAWAFPLVHGLALLQNVATSRDRDVRLTDLPVFLYNVVMGVCLVAAAKATGEDPPGPSTSVLLFDHAVLQHLLGGGFLAGLTTLSWHLPVLVMRREPRTMGQVVLRLMPAVVCAFCVMILAGFHRAGLAAIAGFLDEPRTERAAGGLRVGVLARVEHEDDPARVPGDVAAWILPADHDGALPRPGRPLVLELRAPDAWTLALPPRDEIEETFLSGAERLARALSPEILLPFPSPDLLALPIWREPLDPDRWQALFLAARRRVDAASPDTRLGVRLASADAYTRDLYRALVDVVDVMGPRLQPTAGSGAAFAEDVLYAWRRWRERDAGPELWLLAVGLSPYAYGEQAQARFVEGWIARAGAEEDVAGILIDGWRDVGHTTGLVAATGRPRPAARRLRALLDGH